MTSCILMLVKNELEYLDEFIKYHLNLGVNHIFIFEDIDSTSHKEITDKYNAVTLNSIASVLDENAMREAIDLKKTQRYSVLHLYLRNAVPYIKEKYQHLYEWCFLIDNDEFITLENGNLNDILSLYKDYDAILLRWKCYGASGHIKKPDYSNGGLIKTYTLEIENTFDRPRYHNKTCYKLSTFDASFIKSSHHYPSDDCNYCNTEFVKNLEIPSYKNIYLRHYITKSWEEYVWKKTLRGFLFEKARNLDSFFLLNKDMLDKREELLNSLNKGTLVVLPYKQSGSQGNEIRLALKGWKKYCQFKYHFVVIGEYDSLLEKEFSWVEFINCPTKERKDGQYNPHLDINNKFNIIYRKYGNIYDGFIWMVDDNYAIKPFDLDDIKTIHHHSEGFNGCKKCPISFWRHDKWKTRQLLDRENLPHINYTTHYPCYFEFKRLNEILNKYNLLEESYVVEDLYFNSFEHDFPILDSTIRLGIWDKLIFDNEFQNTINNTNIKFVCNSTKGWSIELETELEKIVI